MASSNSEYHHGQQPAKLARQNSSFLGAIKNIVTAPLNWFGNPAEDEESSGKRRRPIEQVPTEPSLSMDVSLDDEIADATRRSKRMRLNSPPHTTQHYLDPPAAALRLDKPRRTSVVPRASSAVLPSTRSSRATVSPHRRGPVSRTMSIDPPHLRRDTSFTFGTTLSTDVEMPMASIPDASRPPSPSPRSPRLSFRMRSSLTPQPHQLPRHISEPPPLNSLASKPHFVQPPVQAAEARSIPTLGTLVESVRTVRSPTRHQHVSLLLAPEGASNSGKKKDADAAQRALSQLDVYKTPLLPTRLRSSNLPASVVATKTPDMFKSKRGSRLVLMHDDRDRFGKRGTSSKSPVVNETKPYAGEGGMKRLLARRKVEAEEDENENEAENQDSESMKEGAAPREPSPIAPPPPPPVLKLPESNSSDWFSVASSTAPPIGGSSLRVGRTKTSRNHIHRPSRARFSAVYEDEGDDAMDDDREKERMVLEEAAKKAPVFQIPQGFSFAKDAPVPTGDVTTAKEPPIAALPFSFAKPAAVVSAPPKIDVKPAESQSRPISAFPPIPNSTPAFSFDAKSSSTTSGEPQGGIPNFFAKSQIIAKAPPPPVPAPVLNFGTPAPSTQISSAPAQSFLFGQPLKDKESPFWDGEKSKQPMSGPEKSTDVDSTKAEPGHAASLFPPAQPSMTAQRVSAPAPPPAFSFGSGEKKSEPGSLTSSTGAVSLGAPAATSISNFGVGNSKLSVATTTSETKSTLFGNSAGFGETKTVPNNLFGGVTASNTSSSASSPFSFGAPSTTASAPDSLKPSPFTVTPAVASSTTTTGFGATPFSFNSAPSSGKEKEPKSTPFMFGNPATPASETKSLSATPAPFSFGQATTSVPATTSAPAFSFSGGSSSNTNTSSKSPFTFGQTPANNSNDMDSDIERPVTPPKNSDQEFRMEESPTRELHQVNNKPAMNGGFSFGGSTINNAGGGLFDRAGTASPLPAPAPFSFGATTSTNAFGAKESQPAAAKPFSFGNAAAPTPITTSFSFGQPNKGPEDSARPATGGGFNFGVTPTSTTAPAPSFSFGGNNTFGSAPSSPSTFNQPAPFSFGNPAPAAGSPFTFGGSQPASPAGGASLTLPPPASGGFGASTSGFGQVATPQPSSPFSAPTSLAPSTSSGGALFTIGAAPSPGPNAGGARQIKKLPTRRAGAKR